MKPLTFRAPRILGLGAAIAVALVAAAIALASVAAGERPPTKGPLPPEALKPDGIDLSLAPDYVQALGPRGNVVGYIPKEYLATTIGPVTGAPLGADGRPTSQTLPVLGDDLKTLVGHHVPGIGFVPIGAVPEAMPPMLVEAAPAP